MWRRRPRRCGTPCASGQRRTAQRRATCSSDSPTRLCRKWDRSLTKLRAKRVKCPQAPGKSRALPGAPFCNEMMLRREIVGSAPPVDRLRSRRSRLIKLARDSEQDGRHTTVIFGPRQQTGTVFLPVSAQWRTFVVKLASGESACCTQLSAARQPRLSSACFR